MRNIFLEKFPLFPDLFLKSQNVACIWINSLKFYVVFFIVCQVEGYRNKFKLSCRRLAFTSYNAFFFKKERDLELVSLPHFLHDLKKYFFSYILLTDQISLSGYLYFMRYCTTVISK